MQYSQAQHEQIVRALEKRGEHTLASQYADWIDACMHFPRNGDPREEEALERKERVFLLFAKERGIFPR